MLIGICFSGFLFSVVFQPYSRLLTVFCLNRSLFPAFEVLVHVHELIAIYFLDFLGIFCSQLGFSFVRTSSAEWRGFGCCPGSSFCCLSYH